MRFVVTGAGGQLGRCLVDLIGRRPDAVCLGAFDHAGLDISDPDAVERALSSVSPGAEDVLVNAAAFTAVDRCESEWALALAVNGAGPGHLARACRDRGMRMVHVSTDYVFDGQATRPYAPDAEIAPRTAYGRSKAEGEYRVLDTLEDALVVRTSWVFGPGHNFVAAILRQARLRRDGEAEGPLRVVDDQVGGPTYAADLAAGLLDLAAAAAGSQAVRGRYHLANAGAITWWDFAREILDTTGDAALSIDRARTVDLNLPADRPRYSVLDCSRAAEVGIALRDWKAALADYLASPAGLALRGNT